MQPKAATKTVSFASSAEITSDQSFSLNPSGISQLIGAISSFSSVETNTSTPAAVKTSGLASLVPQVGTCFNALDGSIKFDDPDGSINVVGDVELLQVASLEADEFAGEVTAIVIDGSVDCSGMCAGGGG